MKNIIKKITAITMAFTLLGSGTAITKNVSPQSDNSITASAASCQHHCYCYQSLVETYDPYKSYPVGIIYYNFYYRTINVRCGNCNKILYSYPIEPTTRYEYKNGKPLW